MLNKLLAIMPNISYLLTDHDRWDSLIINRRKPHTYRVFTQLEDGYRLCLHKFNPCDRHEAFAHPHPWPGAFFIVSGSYRMNIGYSKDRESAPENVAEVVLTTGSSYEIINPLTWHSVIPLEETYTIMLNGEPWGPEIAHKEVRTTKGKDLEKMSKEELSAHLGKFNSLCWGR